jgi:TRAP-type C4-dicarboxylate transport system permease small subunit
MLNAYDKAVRAIGKVVLAALIVIGCSMLVITWAHVFYRYFLNNSLTWSEEVLKIMVVWFCLLSATFISSRKEHVSIVIFKQALPKFIERHMDIFTSFLMFAVSLAMCYIGWRLKTWAGIRRTPATGFPISYMYLSIFVAFGIMAFYELRNFLVMIVDPARAPAVAEPLAPIVEAPEPE